ncbi:MAG: triose-phosphate isomerase [Phycisphaerae bacterium]|nr:triose-phosphate isomerase [Phycisphaerae bacterium]
MMTPLILGNWKMNTAAATAAALAREVAQGAPASGVSLGVCPPLVYLPIVAEACRGSRVAVGAQNVAYEKNGAFTGEVSAAMLKDVGATYVLLGHSERRHTIDPHEDDRVINRKLLAVLAEKLVPVLCVGETLAEREAGRTMDVITTQMKQGLAGVKIAAANELVIAYEPVWAIGTGKVATPAQAQEAHAHTRSLLRAQFGDLAKGIAILYGGSMKPDNAREICSQPDVNGGLIGGASLKSADFLAIGKAALEATR